MASLVSMKIIDPRHVHAVALCREPHTVHILYQTLHTLLADYNFVSAHVNYLQGKIQRNSLQGNTEVTAVHLAQRNQLLGWKNMLCDLLVEWFWFKDKCARSKYITERKSKTHFAEEEQQWSYSSTLYRQPNGHKLLPWPRGDAWTWTTLWCQWCSLGLLPSLLLTPPSQSVCDHGSMCLRVAELLGWQGKGTHTPYLWVMMMMIRGCVLGLDTAFLPTLMTAQQQTLHP